MPDIKLPVASRGVADAKALRFLGGMQGTVPHQTILSCPQNGALSLYCICGSCSLNEGRNRWRLPDEAVVLVRTGQTPVLSISEHPLRILSIVVQTDLSFTTESSTAVFTPKQNRNGAAEQLFAALLEQLPGESEDTLLREFLSRLADGTQSLPPNETQAPDSIYLLKQILDTRYSEKLTLDMLADELHWNKYKLEKDFKRYFHCSLFEYLMNVRVNAACRLLRETGCSVVDTGLSVGMENTSYFIRVFKRRTGMSPLQYRSLTAEDVRLPVSRKL